jgi:hypothetical protein
MKRILDRLPPDVASRVHPDWKRNEESYWARRETLLRQYEGKWIGFADDTVIASGDRPVQVLHAAQRTGRHPFVTCVGREDTPQKMRRSIYSYDTTYRGEPLPRVTVDFRAEPNGPGVRFEDTIPDIGADASALPWPDCQGLQLNPEEGVPALMGGAEEAPRQPLRGPRTRPLTAPSILAGCRRTLRAASESSEGMC